MNNVTPEEKKALIEAAKKATDLIMSTAKTHQTQLVSASIIFSVIAEYHNVAALTVGENDNGLMTYVSDRAIQENPQLVDMMIAISETAGKSVTAKKNDHFILQTSELSVH